MNRPVQNPQRGQGQQNATPLKPLKPSPVDAFSAFGVLKLPEEVAEPILPGPTRVAVHQWMRELNAVSALKEVGVTPRRRVMLSGPPGTGKTTLAHHVAARLGIPLLIVESSNMIEGLLGGTGKNIVGLFRLAREHDGKVALFFDEVDALTPARGGATGSAERDNIVIALLQALDDYGQKGLIFAATNRPEAIDAAIWRRFSMRIDVGMPGDDEQFAIVKRYLAPMQLDDESLGAIADVLDGASPADLKEIVETIKRDLVMSKLMQFPADVMSVMTRVASVLQPAVDPLPPLWSNPEGTASHLANITWPPTMGRR